MTIEKEIKKITLFPNEVHPLSEDALIDYVSPMGELEYFPKVNKGFTIRVSPDGRVDKIDAWTAEFTHKENLFKVTVDVDRVVIETTARVELHEMLEKVTPIINIVIRNNPQGLSRIAIGFTTFGTAKLEELKNRIRISEEEFKDESAREKREQFVKVKGLKNEKGVELLKYNEVHSFKVIWHREDMRYIDDYDINTSIDTPIEAIIPSMDSFFSEVVKIFSGINA